MMMKKIEKVLLIFEYNNSSWNLPPCNCQHDFEIFEITKKLHDIKHLT